MKVDPIKLADELVSHVQSGGRIQVMKYEIIPPVFLVTNCGILHTITNSFEEAKDVARTMLGFDLMLEVCDEQS